MTFKSRATIAKELASPASLSPLATPRRISTDLEEVPEDSGSIPSLIEKNSLEGENQSLLDKKRFALIGNSTD
eukprot:CAMPEP_0170511782 /NCGR_PEP_ID=MMETSP0208-20121228/66491_1 /TAXON_ID=197538 /ORGANISM="Strombidium inclinatum, Strain S3" /LENGTH=72 /DNA_ID=CAMNT_0010795349 /DNA_START=1220 /DNA_END=1438 /DNA_ORIENTATION=-